MDTTAPARITWLGHACFHIECTDGTSIVIDPWFEGNPSFPATSTPEHVDAILATHGHDDHVHDVIPLAQRTGATVVAIVELGAWLTGKGLPADKLISMNKGGTVHVGSIAVTMVHAQHTSSNDGPAGLVYLGEPAGYIIELPDGYRIYHAGDTNVFGDMDLIAKLYAPDLALLPIGGHYTMDPAEAAIAIELLGSPEVIGMHWGTFPLLAGTPEELQRLSPAARIHALRPGQSIGPIAVGVSG